jgi:uroporphyrinogen-III decarboxylase
MLSDRLPVTAILAQIAAYASTPAGKVIMLRVNAPYSVLAGLVEQPLFYRWLAKESEAVHAGLERVTGGLARYIRAGFERGVRIISIADPFANPAILGEKRCCDFACVWLSKLLEKIAPIPGLVTHICPQSSLLLEQHGFVTAAPFPTREANAEHSTLYLDFLINIVEEAKSAILGHQCIYAQETAQMVHLRLTGN